MDVPPNRLIGIGYWNDHPSDCWVNPALLIDPGAYENRKREIVMFLKYGIRINTVGMLILSFGRFDF